MPTLSVTLALLPSSMRAVNAVPPAALNPVYAGSYGARPP
ncbi:hypothetical protein PAMC26510_23950 [Caballeronia sordidicola]|uniref:Uncharacterized protein n=1 Tax=Caballeronia sordidicola TaxID=196367 RepID=A0A242MJC9_CABSO|nr:hypothetical protein PAMC26510_23950 [Caballeronia sordidicola]